MIHSIGTREKMRQFYIFLCDHLNKSINTIRIMTSIKGRNAVLS